MYLYELTYAGPDPLNPVTTSNKDSGTTSHKPTADINDLVVASSASVAADPKVKTEAPHPTITGMLGITLTTLEPCGKS